MTFEQFQSTRQHLDDIATILPDYSLGTEGPVPGFIYLGSLAIEDVLESWPAAAKAEGKHYLRIANMEWISNDLGELERKLHQFAIDEGFTL